MFSLDFHNNNFVKVIRAQALDNPYMFESSARDRKMAMVVMVVGALPKV